MRRSEFWPIFTHGLVCLIRGYAGVTTHDTVLRYPGGISEQTPRNPFHLLTLRTRLCPNCFEVLFACLFMSAHVGISQRLSRVGLPLPISEILVMVRSTAWLMPKISVEPFSYISLGVIRSRFVFCFPWPLVKTRNNDYGDFCFPWSLVPARNNDYGDFCVVASEHEAVIDDYVCFSRNRQDSPLPMDRCRVSSSAHGAQSDVDDRVPVQGLSFSLDTTMYFLLCQNID